MTVTTSVDAKITAFVTGKPWLKMILTVAMAILGVAKGRGWFMRKYGIE